MTPPRSVLCPHCGTPRKRYMKRTVGPDGFRGTYLFCSPCNERRKKERASRVWGRHTTAVTEEKMLAVIADDDARARKALADAGIRYPSLNLVYR